MEVVGILLAAGRGERFDATGREFKLLHARRSGPGQGEPLALAAARNLRSALGTVVAVVRPGCEANQQRLRRLLEDAGCIVVDCPAASRADEGMGLSLASGVAARPQAAGWIVALADMPGIDPATITAVRTAILQGADCAAPYFNGRRGHPVGFGAVCGPELAVLRGDAGGRAVLERYPPLRVEVNDPGILLDVDVAADL
jgi:molybdenum cofactor cytidylyltransferase